jgi:hypothetical protein
MTAVTSFRFAIAGGNLQNRQGKVLRANTPGLQ